MYYNSLNYGIRRLFICNKQYECMFAKGNYNIVQYNWGDVIGIRGETTKSNR